MKQIYAALATILALGLVAGCHANGQQPPSPSAYTCSAATGAYVEINPPTTDLVPASITVTTFKWTPPSGGAYCVVVQAWAVPSGATIYQASLPSNIVQPTTTTLDPVIDLSWTAPATTPVYGSYSYILSYSVATPVGIPTAPPLNTPTTSVSLLAKPLFQADITLAVVAQKQ